jgi:hypothetical protein
MVHLLFVVVVPDNQQVPQVEVDGDDAPPELVGIFLWEWVKTWVDSGTTPPILPITSFKPLSIRPSVVLMVKKDSSSLSTGGTSANGNSKGDLLMAIQVSNKSFSSPKPEVLLGLSSW